MSTQYYNIEKFHIHNVESIDEEIQFSDDAIEAGIYGVSSIIIRLQEKIAGLSIPMIYKEGYISDMVLTLDGETFSFYGDIITKECAEAIRSMTSANDIDLYIRYDFNGNYYDYDFGYLLRIMRLLPEELFKYMSYSIYTTTDSYSHEGGSLFSFGNDENNSSICTLLNYSCPIELPFEEKAIPEDAEWMSADTYYCLDQFPCSPEEHKKIAELASAFNKYEYGEPDFRMNANGTTDLWLNQVFLRNKKELREFIDDLQRLNDYVMDVANRLDAEGYSEFNCGPLCEFFVDYSHAGPRMMRPNLDYFEGETITIAG